MRAIEFVQIVELCSRVRVCWFGVVETRCVERYVPVYVPVYVSVCTYAYVPVSMPAYVKSCAEWIVIIQFSDFRSALFVFALLSCDCCTFAWLRALIYVLLLRCCSFCFATPVQPGCFECLLFCLQHISCFVDC